MKRIRLTPTLLALALLCFFLPWFEIRCDMGTITQSGWQRARGTMTIEQNEGREAGEPFTSEPDEKHSDPNAAWHGVSVAIGLCIALLIHAYPWRHFLLFVSSTSAFVFLAWVTRNYYLSTEPAEELPWKFTPWFFLAWSLNAAALSSVVGEICIYVWRPAIHGNGEETSLPIRPP